jgi:DNA (cytosine-5)-methyltransferase 1
MPAIAAPAGAASLSKMAPSDDEESEGDSEDAPTLKAPLRARAGKPTVVELFAGAGGMAVGLEQAGFEHVALVERDRQAVRTLRRNGFKDVQYRDARDVDYSRWQGVDLVAGGPPCQPFSLGGVDGGDADPRDGWPTAARAVAEIRPRAFLFENVAGLARDKFEPYLESVLKRFYDLGYCVHVRLVDAADYGIPQHRRRMLMVGFRGVHWFPRPPAAARHVTVGETFADLGPPNGKNGHALHRVASRPYAGHTGSTLDKPAKTLTAGCNGPSGGSNMVQLADGTCRYFTLREQARLQSFPDWYKLHDTWSHGVKQLGNACPVKLAEVFGRAVLRVLDAQDAQDASS